MTSNVKLLPLPAEIRARDFKWAAVEVYARACVEASTKYYRDMLCQCQDDVMKLRDEVEALRAEREVIVAEAVKYADKSGRLEAKVDRLAEAGRRVTAAFRAHGEASSFTRQAERTRHECEAAMLSLDDALRDHEQEVGNWTCEMRPNT